MMFQNPAVLLLLLVVPLVAVVSAHGERLRRARLRRLGDLALLQPLLLAADHARYRQKLGLWAACVCCVIIALARPTWGLESSPVRQQGVSLLLLLDVSSSMNAQDLLPSRLTRARLDAVELMRQMAGNEFGLILFAGSAFLQFPLTVDWVTAETFLQAASSDSISRQGTNLEAALRVALETFRRIQSRDRVVIVLSDGESLDGDALTVADELARADVTIYALGYGTVGGAEIPLPGGGVKTDVDGNIVRTRLDENELRRIAERGGGSYWNAEQSGVAPLVERLRTHETGGLSGASLGRPVERFGLFLALAVTLLGIEMLLSEVRRRAA